MSVETEPRLEPIAASDQETKTECKPDLSKITVQKPLPIIWTVMKRENMGEDARKTTAKVSRPSRIFETSICPTTHKKLRGKQISFDTQKAAEKWIALNGDKQCVYYVVHFNNPFGENFGKWVWKTSKWGTTDYRHPNELM